MWFIPVLNPDGYVYNESLSQMVVECIERIVRDTGCGNGTSRGVDLNRNFGYNWGAQMI